MFARSQNWLLVVLFAAVRSQYFVVDNVCVSLFARAWSKNLDSAASVFPPSTLPPTLDLDIWGEIYGDLSSWCPEPLQDTSCTMVGDRKGSNCIVQDDELNTPETGVDFTSLLGVMDTSSAVKEGNGGKRDLKLDLPTPLDIDEMIKSILNQDEQFDLVSYVLDDRVPVTALPADAEFTTKPATNTKVLSSPVVNSSQLEDLLLLRETCGHPEKWEYPSDSKENISSRNSSPQSKLSTSVDDESCTPAKRSRMPSVNHTCD